MNVRVAGLLLVLAVLVVSPPGALAEAPGAAGDTERERKFVDALQGEDPSSAERYVALREARAKAVAELQLVEAQFRAAGAELRPMFLPNLRQAQRRYAESSLALLDFLDARDRRALATYREEISRIDRLLEEHEHMRVELTKLLQEN